MRVRTFLFILLAMLVVYAASSLFVSNREVLERPFHFWGDVNLPVGLALLIFFVVGVGITVLAGLTREAGMLVDRSRRRKATKRAEEIEEEYTRGLAAVLEGREEEALRHFRAVLERDSRHFNTLLKIGEVLRHEEKYAEAIEFHRKAHHLKEDDPRPLYDLVEDHEAKGDLDRARAVLGKIIALKKHSVLAWRKLRSLHIKERGFAKALEAHERVEKYSEASDPRDNADARVGLGIRYEMAAEQLRAGRAREAMVALRKILKDDPRFIPAHVLLGEAVRHEGKDREAIEAWEHAFESTNDPVFLTMIEDHFLEREQPLAAIESLKRCAARAGRDTLARFFLGKLYFRLEMLDDALAVLSSLESRASYAPTLHYLLGRIHERRKNHRDAAAEYRKVIKDTELVQLEYRCRACGETSMEWVDRCPDCGEWNSIELNFREEMSLEELGLPPAPVYTARK
ncbi:MAG: tetratricopeptide repeat protein [Acidobacteriia bacterium]|nr:tetratricopeptide repeat protein [Terriglobia bacterium]